MKNFIKSSLNVKASEELEAEVEQEIATADEADQKSMAEIIKNEKERNDDNS